jgi:peptidoglycan/xylan/chitin deacetylase (PgdA/CDA1 family)
LEEYKVKTTFFVVGQWVDKFPESVKQLHDAGHEVMNHSNTHPHYTKLTPEKIKEEALACDEKIQKITGVKPYITRMPYGDYDNKVVTALKEIGHYAVQWDVDSLDWKNPSPDQIVKRVTDNVKDGSIVLFHNAAANTPKALPQVLKALQAKGFQIVPVSEVIYKDNYTIDHKGTQIPGMTE